MRRTLLSLLGVLAVAGLATGGVLAYDAITTEATGSDDTASDDTAASGDAEPLSTTTVRQTDLVTTTEIDGTLGFGSPVALPNRAAGVITWLPEAGAVIQPGDVLYEVNDLPVLYLPGDQTAYRTLRNNTEGDDVLQLEEFLDEQGHMAPLSATVDGDFTSYTGDALEDWFEAAHGVLEQDEIPDGWVVFGNDEFRISSVTGSVGGQLNGGSVLSTTGTTRVVTVQLDTALSGVLTEGQEVLVELPDETEVAAVVTFVAGVVTTEGQGPNAVSWIDVELELAGSGTGFDESPVTIVVDDAIELDATVVPISALVALAEGGFAVEVMVDGEPRLTAVTPVNFLGNDVSIDGDVQPGDVVVIP